jgi:hypothetical protein
MMHPAKDRRNAVIRNTGPCAAMDNTGKEPAYSASFACLIVVAARA